MNAWFDLAAPAWRLAGWTMLHFLWAGTLVALAGAAMRIACRRAAPGVRYGASLMTLATLAALPVGIVGCLSAQPKFAASLQPRALPGGSGANATTIGDGGDGKLLAGATPGQSPGPKDALPVIDLAKTDAAIQLPTLPGRSGTEGLNAARTSGDEALLAGATSGQSPGLTAASAIFERVVRWLPVVWLVGAPLTFALLAAGLVGSRRLRVGAAAIVDGPVFEACRRLEKSLGMARRVALAACDRLAQPVLVGIVRPTILLPASALTGWTVEELEMVLLHELAHVRRWDNLVNLAQRVVESLLFFHPCVWVASTQVRRDREECCDAVVVRHTARPEEYASLLVSIAVAVRGRRSARLATALAAASAMADHPLAGRVRRILKLEDQGMRVSRKTLGLTMAVVIAALSALYYGSAPAADPTISPEEASAKPVATIEYSADEIDRIGPYWVRLFGRGDAKQAEIRWKGQTNAATITAPQGFHDTIAMMLAGRGEDFPTYAFTVRGPRALKDKVDALVAEFERNPDALELETVELPKLKAEIETFRAQIQSIDKELVDLEVLKSVALQQARSPSALDAVLIVELDKDPTIANYKQQLFDLSVQIQALAASTNNRDGAQLKRLQSAYTQTENATKQYRVQAEKEARERLKQIPNEALRAAANEYKMRKKFLTDRKAELEEKLKAVEKQLSELTAAQTGVDGGEASAPTVKKQTLVAGLPDDVSPDDARQLVRQLRTEGYDAYAILAEQGGIHLEVRNLDAKFALTWTESIADGKRHYNFRLTTPPPAESAVPPTSAPISNATATLVVRVHSDGTIEVGGELLTPEALKNRLETEGGWHEQRVIIHADKGCPYAHVAGVVEACRAAKVQAIAVDAQPSALSTTAPTTTAPTAQASPAASDPFGGASAESAQAESFADAGAAQFLSSRDQQTADLAYAALAWELEPLRADELELVKKAGFKGGVRVERNDSSRSSPRAGAFVVGLHTWSVVSFDHLLEILSSEKFADLESVKFYFLANNGTAELPNWSLESGRVSLKRPEAGATRNNAPTGATELHGSDMSNDAPRQDDPTLVATGADADPSDVGRKPFKLSPDDMVRLRAVGSLPDAPLDGNYTIEAEGTLALGPIYGRVKLSGLTVTEAEAAIVEHLKATLQNPQVQLTVTRRRKTPVEPPREPRKLIDGDEFVVRVAGALPDQPIEDVFRIESGGTIPLGPIYGRVAVTGLTIADAEKAIEAHLKTILVDPHVQLTLKRPLGAGREDGDRTTPAKAVFLYDGKTFSEWRGVLKNELSLSRRNGAVRALAAFARAGQGREAVEAIFDVAGEYDFRTISVGSVEGELKDCVLDELTTTTRTRVSELVWLPVLQERLTADETKWKWLAVQLLTRLTTDDESAKAILDKLGTSDDQEIRQAAKAARERGLPKPREGAALSSDPPKQATGWQALPGGSYRY